MFVVFSSFSSLVMGEEGDQIQLRKVSECSVRHWPYHAAVHERTVFVVYTSGLIESFDFFNRGQIVKNNGSYEGSSLGNVFPIMDLINDWNVSHVFERIDLQWPYLFVPTRNLLQIVDVRDPSSMKQAGVYQPSVEIFSNGIVSVFGDSALYAYKTETEWMLETLDLTDVQFPIDKGRLVLPCPPSHIMWDGGSHAFIFPPGTNDETNLQINIVDVSNLKEPQIISSIPTAYFSVFLKVVDKIYICNTPELESASYTVYVYNVSNPELPVLESSTEIEAPSKGNFPLSLYRVGDRWIGQNALGNARIGGGALGLYQWRDSIPVLNEWAKSVFHGRVAAKIDNLILSVFIPLPNIELSPSLYVYELIHPSSMDCFDRLK